jgi:hypothetical protein
MPRLKQVEVSVDLLQDLLTAGREFGPMVIAEGIPAGARLWSVGMQPNPFERLHRVEIRTISLVFEHESFPEAQTGVMPESLTVIVHQVAPFPRQEAGV